MSRSILSRLGAGVFAAALVAGGSLLAAGPAAAAAPGTITVANTQFQSGAGWGEGIQVAGVDFAPNVEVTVSAGVGNGNSGTTWGETKVTSGPTGAFETTFVPESGPVDVPEGSRATVIASYPNPAVTDPTDPDSVLVSNVVELQIAAFVPAAQNVTVDPICLSGDAVRETGVTVGATGFGQFETGITYSVVDANGTVVPGDNETLTADETGSIPPAALTLFSTAGNISDGQYTITFVGSVTTAGVFQVGACEAPAAPAAPEAPVAAPAGPQLANTGSHDAGLLVGGAAAFLLVGAALVVARRRTVAAA